MTVATLWELPKPGEPENPSLGATVTAVLSDPTMAPDEPTLMYWVPIAVVAPGDKVAVVALLTTMTTVELPSCVAITVTAEEPTVMTVEPAPGTLCV